MNRQETGALREREAVLTFLRAEAQKDTGTEEHILTWAAARIEEGAHHGIPLITQAQEPARTMEIDRDLMNQMVGHVQACLLAGRSRDRYDVLEEAIAHVIALYREAQPGEPAPSPDIDSIGSHIGNGGQFDPVAGDAKGVDVVVDTLKDGTRKMLEAHYPVGMWKQPCGNYALPCSCGETIWGHSTGDTQWKWAFHVAPFLATPPSAPAQQGWLPIDTVSAGDRVIVAGYQARNGAVAGYWWYHEDAIDDAGKPCADAYATHWRPFDNPPFPTPPAQDQGARANG